MHREILKFWFEEIEESNWWIKDENFDKLIEKRFGSLHKKAASCELYTWRNSPEGRLAEIIILDQFSRNIHRDKPEAFASDSLALALAQETIALGADKELNQTQRLFLYLPYMHSESIAIHHIALELYRENGLQKNLDFEVQHLKIIEKFGRYPHRNKILSRESTPEEILFLKEPGSSF